MRHGVPVPSRCVALTLVALLAPSDSVAQSWEDLHPGTWEGSLELGVGYDSEKLHSSEPDQNASFSRRINRERLTIGNQNFFFVDPDLLTGSLSVTLEQVHFRESSNGTEDSRHARFIGYAFDTTLFGGLPYYGRLYANRNQVYLNQPFGHTDLTFSNAGATLQLREDSPLRDMGFPFFSASVRAEEQQINEKTTSVLGQTSQQNEHQGIVGVDAHKGFETADLDFHYLFNNVTDSTYPALNFQNQTGTLNYSVDFGPTLNNRSDSRLFFFSRTGASPIRLFNADESLRLDHQENLSTTYRYLFTRSEAPTGTTTTQAGTFDVYYEPYKHLTADGLLSVLRQNLPFGTSDTDAARLALQYQHGLPGDGTLTARAAGLYQMNNNQLRQAEINVTDESQAAPSPLGAGAGFTLGNPFVIASSIVVVDMRGGARLPTAPGVDYEIIAEGNITRIVPLPTSAVIRAGDPLVVSYIYQVNPSIKYNTTTQAYSLGLSFPWLIASLEHDQTNQTPVSGFDTRFLEDTRKDVAQATLQGTWKNLWGEAGASYTRYNATFLAYTQEQYLALLSYRPSAFFTASFTAVQTSTDFTLPAHRTEQSSAQLTLDWYALGGGWSNWWTTALLGRRVYKDSLLPTETINEANLTARFNYGLLDLSAVLTASERSFSGQKTNNWSVLLTAIRRF
jgi:hypothetical protein